MTGTSPWHEAHDDAIMLAAFEGWNDAADAASTALEYLHDLWDAQPVGELNPDDYHDFQVNRPLIQTNPSGERELVWPTTHVTMVQAPRTGRRVILVHGIEPSMRWRDYCTELLTLAHDLGVSTILTIGALLADVPHTRPIPVSVTSEDTAIQALLGVEASSYEGPTGISGVLQDAAATARLHTASLWAAVPHYVAHPPSPKAVAAILGRLEEVLSESIERGSLLEDAAAWQAGVDELASDDPEVAEYVRSLEEAKDTADLPEASGEAIAQEIQRYLRHRDDRSGGRGRSGKGRAPQSSTEDWRRGNDGRQHHDGHPDDGDHRHEDDHGSV